MAEQRPESETAQQYRGIMPDRASRRDASSAIPAPPVHILSALATIALDAVWGTAEVGGAASGIGLLALPLLVLITGGLDFLAVFTIQKFIARDGFGSAFAKALVLSILAGVPFMVMGTAAGAFLLGWAGLSNLARLGDGKR